MPAWYAESGKTLVTNQEETSRRFYTTSHPFYRGIDLYARTMSAGILDQVGATLWPRHMTATPEALLKAISACFCSYRERCQRCTCSGSSPEPAPHWRTLPVYPGVCIGGTRAQRCCE